MTLKNGAKLGTRNNRSRRHFQTKREMISQLIQIRIIESHQPVIIVARLLVILARPGGHRGDHDAVLDR